MSPANNSFISLALSMASCSLVGAGVSDLVFAQSAQAQESTGAGGSCIDWTKLELNPQQNTQIQSLESQWYKEFSDISPQIREDQTKLQRLLTDRNPDSLQVVALQQAIARRKEQLNLAAMQNYLAKKKVLNEKQQTQFEQMIQQNIQRRKMMLNPGSQTEVMPDKIQNLMQRVKNIFPVENNKGNP